MFFKRRKALNYRQHVAVGTILGIATQYSTKLPMSGSLLAYPSYYGGVILGSLLPDIDHPKSYLGRQLPFISVPIFKLFGHRGFTHSLLSLSILGVATAKYWAVNPLLWGGLLLGYFSHILADMCTPSGVPLFYPHKKRYKFFKKRNKK